MLSPSANIRHDLPPELVADQTNQRLEKLEARRVRDKKMAQELVAQYQADLAAGRQGTWRHLPTPPEVIDRRIDDSVQTELSYYQLVRVIQLANAPESFVLVYGTTNDAEVCEGTGPFKSLERAIAWYASGGR